MAQKMFDNYKAIPRTATHVARGQKWKVCILPCLTLTMIVVQNCDHVVQVTTTQYTIFVARWKGQSEESRWLEYLWTEAAKPPDPPPDDWLVACSEWIFGKRMDELLSYGSLNLTPGLMSADGIALKIK